jgi:hypothetical protein
MSELGAAFAQVDDGEGKRRLLNHNQN